MQRIPVAGPWITAQEADYVREAALNGWYDLAGLYPDRFERAFADYLGVRHAVTLPSCTSAIHLSLAALGVGPGDEVVVPDITWIATAAPITYVGATPVFADIDPATWCLSSEALETVITPRTKAVIPVDLYGNLPDMGAIRAIARRYDLAIIEDAAEAMGSEYSGRRAGAFGDTGVFSFHGSKTLTTGEGGMLVTANQQVWERVLQLRDHGRKPGDPTFWNTEVAYKYKMSSLQAALGLAQLERIDQLVARKRLLFDWYREFLADSDLITLNSEPPGTKNSYWMTTVILDPSLRYEKHELQQDLAQRGIDSRPFFHPLSSLPAYAASDQARAARRRNHVAYGIAPFGLNLPSALTLSRDQIAFVCEALKELIRSRASCQVTSSTTGGRKRSELSYTHV